MKRYDYPVLAQATTGPKWVSLPAKTDWPFIAGVATVAAAAAALLLLGKKK